MGAWTCISWRALERARFPLGTLPHLAVFGLDTLEFDEGLPASEVGHRNHFKWELRFQVLRIFMTFLVWSGVMAMTGPVGFIMS